MVRVLKIEIKRLFKSEFFSLFHLLTLILWPILTLLEMYFTFFSFPMTLFSKYGINGTKEVFLFLTLGYLCLIIFQSLVQSAWQMMMEKTHGTLEGIFMTPVNRYTWLFARVFSIVISNSFIFFCALFLIFSVMLPFSMVNILKVILSFLIIIFSAVIWGAFLTVLFMALRNGGLLFGIFEGLQECVSGVKIPSMFYPLFLKVIGMIFPLTYTILLVRGLFFSSLEVLDILLYFSTNGFLLVIALMLLKIVERQLRKKGSFNLY